MEQSSDDHNSDVEDLLAEHMDVHVSDNEENEDAPSNAELWRFIKMQSDMQQKQLMMIERLQYVTEEIKVELRSIRRKSSSPVSASTRLKSSSPVSDTSSQSEDSA